MVSSDDHRLWNLPCASSQGNMLSGRSYPSQADMSNVNGLKSNPIENAHQYNYQNVNYLNNYNNYYGYYNNMKDHSSYMNSSNNYHDGLRNCRQAMHDASSAQLNRSTSFKRRKVSESDTGNCYYQPYAYENVASLTFVPGPIGAVTASQACSNGKRDWSCLEDDSDLVFMSREEIERCSPSRKDGIDALYEARLRYSYCAFIQNLGMRLQLPQTTTGTAMVLCHRFFVRRSHASHDRYLIATAALFLAAKSEETSRPLNNVLQASCEILYEQDFTILSYMLPMGWFEQYRERVTVAEQLILTTLNFELEVQHPYDPLTSILNKLGHSQTVLVNLALNLVSEGLRSSLWLQFKPQHIAAGAAYLAAKLLHMEHSCYDILQEFRTPTDVLQNVSQQLMELFQNTNTVTAL